MSNPWYERGRSSTSEKASKQSRQLRNDPRLTRVDGKWYWEGQRVETPVPENSEVSMCIAARVGQETTLGR